MSWIRGTPSLSDSSTVEPCISLGYYCGVVFPVGVLLLFVEVDQFHDHRLIGQLEILQTSVAQAQDKSKAQAWVSAAFGAFSLSPAFTHGVDACCSATNLTGSRCFFLSVPHSCHHACAPMAFPARAGRALKNSDVGLVYDALFTPARSPMAVVLGWSQLRCSAEGFHCTDVALLAGAGPTFGWPAKQTIIVRHASVFRARSGSPVGRPVWWREHVVAHGLRLDSCVVRGLSPSQGSAEDFHRSSQVLLSVRQSQQLPSSKNGCARNTSRTLSRATSRSDYSRRLRCFWSLHLQFSSSKKTRPIRAGSVADDFPERDTGQ